MKNMKKSMENLKKAVESINAAKLRRGKKAQTISEYLFVALEDDLDEIIKFIVDKHEHR